jgi:DNA-binding HxlR family transcriptional regulator
MDGYGQYCPIARGAEIFAARWTPIIVRNMLVGCRTFGEIREGAPGIPRALLTERLRQLEHYGVVTRSPNPAGRGYVYELTEAGQELGAVCDALGAWGARWLELAPAHLDAAMVLWSMCRCMPSDELPDPRMVVRFDLSDGTPQRFWVVAQRPRPEVCIKPPGFEEDLVVRTDSASLAKWQLGWVSLGTAQRYGLMEVQGPVHLQRALAGWAARHQFADIVPAHGAGVAAPPEVAAPT